MGVECAQHRELGSQIRMHELMELLGAAEVLEPVLTEGLRSDSGRQTARNEVTRRLAQENLATVTG